MTERIASEHVDSSRAAVARDVARLPHIRWAVSVDHLLHRSVSKYLRAEVSRVTQQFASQSWRSELRALAHLVVPLGESQRFELLVRRRTSQWRRAVTELLERLDRDWLPIVRHFGVRPDAAITSLSAPLGDSHQSGRAVYCVRFNDDRALIYKPRSVDAEAVFGHAVRALSGQELGMTLASCRVLPRREYGWTEFIQPRYCTSDGEARRFFERQGAFLALFYVVAGSDCLAENMVVHGEHPVWVDTECLCTPELAASIRTTAAPDWMSDSVLTNGFVFLGNTRRESPRQRIALSASCLEGRSQVFNQEDTLRSTYIEAVREGFDRAYRMLLGNTRRWALDRMPLALLTGLRFRVLPRDTVFYLPLADLMVMAPRRSRDLVRREIARLLSSQHGRREWPAAFIRAELRALLRGDVPYWTIGFDQWTMIESGGAAIAGVVTRPAGEIVRRRLGRLSCRDRDEQTWLIEAFLRVRVEHKVV